MVLTFLIKERASYLPHLSVDSETGWEADETFYRATWAIITILSTWIRYRSIHRSWGRGGGESEAFLYYLQNHHFSVFILSSEIAPLPPPDDWLPLLWRMLDPPLGSVCLSLNPPLWPRVSWESRVHFSALTHFAESCYGFKQWRFYEKRLLKHDANVTHTTLLEVLLINDGSCWWPKIEFNFTFLPPAYVVRGKVLFSQVSVCSHLRGGGVTPFPGAVGRGVGSTPFPGPGGRAGGTPFPGPGRGGRGSIPFPGSGGGHRGTLLPRSRLGGTPFPGLKWGDPIPVGSPHQQDVVTPPPIQDWMGYPLPIRR